MKINSEKSFTFIEVIVGIFLILIIFLSILGAYLLSLKVISLSKSKITATAIANGEIEKIRNLDYESIGVDGSFPDGDLQATEIVIQGGIQFTIQRRVDYVADPADGLDSSSGDLCPLDYKRAEIKVSWLGNFGGQIIMTTDVAPKNLAQECATGGGILSVSVFDAYGIMVSSPLIEIKDPATEVTLKTFTPSEDQYPYPIPLDVSTYKVVVSKNGYSSERTYGTDEVTTPDNPHPMILEGQLTPLSLSIDKLSSFSIDTLSLTGGSDSFSDSFSDETKISGISDLVVSDGKVELAKSNGDYFPNGYLISAEITSTNLFQWSELSFSDLEPIDTNIKYQVYYDSGTGWESIPDLDLPGNSAGFTVSPIDLSGLSITIYDKLKIRGDFSSLVLTETPILYNWQLSWITNESIPIPNAAFSLRGNKTIGKNSSDDPVYKYSLTTSTDSSGHKDLQNLEWDLYTFSIAPASGLDLIDIQPSPQPINLLPDTNSSVKLYLDAQNSFLLTVQDAVNLQPIFSVTVRIYNTGLGYDQTQYTNMKGQTYFIPLNSATYNLEISSSGYLPTSTTVSVFGDKTKIMNLEQEE